MNRIKTSQIKDFYSIINAFADNGVIIGFSPDMSNIAVDCRSFKFVTNFSLKYFNYYSLCLLINREITRLNGGVSIKDLISKFDNKNGSKINDK